MRSVNRQVSFADLELEKQGVAMEPVLQTIANFLDDNREIIEKIGADLRRGLKNPDTGRNGLTPQQVLRSLVLMRVKDFDYRELRERIADGYTLRQFTDFYSQPVPKHDADLSMEAAACIGCGACVAACPNSSAMLFVAAKASHLGLLPQGQAERHKRVIGMVRKMDELGFGNCRNHYECEAVCPAEVSSTFSARLNRDYVAAVAGNTFAV